MGESAYPRPSVTVDIVAFTMLNSALCIRLVRRSSEPFIKRWSLPGGFVRIDESLDDAAGRVLRRESGISSAYREQLYTFGNPQRDPRERVISVAYLAIVPPDRLAEVADIQEPSVSDADWVAVTDLPDLAFDHNEIVSLARARLVSKLEYSSIAFCFLPERFTLSAAQQVYETVSGRAHEKRNFRKKLLALGFIEDTGEKTSGGAHRPASLYQRIEQADLEYWD